MTVGGHNKGREKCKCRQQVAAVMLSLEDELSVLDLRYADLLQSVQRLSGCDEEDAEVSCPVLVCQQHI